MTQPDQAPTGGLPPARSMQRSIERRERAQEAPRRLARSFVALPAKVNPKIIIAVVAAVVVLAFSLATPLRNYYQQRTELANLRNTIAAQEQRKSDLEDELNRYNNEEYLKEQARVRLGVIEPGESAFRIMSPKITTGDPNSPEPGTSESETEAGLAENQDEPWFRTLWDSIAIPPEDSPTGDGDGPTEELRVPTLPEENPQG